MHLILQGLQFPKSFNSEAQINGGIGINLIDDIINKNKRYKLKNIMLHNKNPETINLVVVTSEFFIR